MKPCAHNRELLVWLNLNALSADQKRALSAHLETCEGCRGYLAETSQVTEKLAAAGTTSEVQATERFHQKLAGKLRAETREPSWEIWALGQRFWGLWRVALPAIAALVLVGIIVAHREQPGKLAAQRPPANQTPVVSGAEENLEPTVANYQRVAKQSMEKLDQLLTQQGRRPLPAMPIYTVSKLAYANEAY